MEPSLLGGFLCSSSACTCLILLNLHAGWLIADGSAAVLDSLDDLKDVFIAEMVGKPAGHWGELAALAPDEGG